MIKIKPRQRRRILGRMVNDLRPRLPLWLTLTEAHKRVIRHHLANVLRPPPPARR